MSEPGRPSIQTRADDAFDHPPEQAEPRSEPFVALGDDHDPCPACDTDGLRHRRRSTGPSPRDGRAVGQRRPVRPRGRAGSTTTSACERRTPLPVAPVELGEAAAHVGLGGQSGHRVLAGEPVQVAQRGLAPTPRRARGSRRTRLASRDEEATCASAGRGPPPVGPRRSPALHRPRDRPRRPRGIPPPRPGPPLPPRVAAAGPPAPRPAAPPWPRGRPWCAASRRVPRPRTVPRCLPLSPADPSTCVVHRWNDSAARPMTRYRPGESWRRDRHLSLAGALNSREQPSPTSRRSPAGTPS